MLLTPLWGTTAARPFFLGVGFVFLSISAIAEIHWKTYSIFIIFENRKKKKTMMKSEQVNLETILAPLGRPLETMLDVFGGLWQSMPINNMPAAAGSKKRLIFQAQVGPKTPNMASKDLPRRPTWPPKASEVVPRWSPNRHFSASWFMYNDYNFDRGSPKGGRGPGNVPNMRST